MNAIMDTELVVSAAIRLGFDSYSVDSHWLTDATAVYMTRKYGDGDVEFVVMGGTEKMYIRKIVLTVDGLICGERNVKIPATYKNLQKCVAPYL